MFVIMNSSFVMSTVFCFGLDLYYHLSDIFLEQASGAFSPAPTSLLACQRTHGPYQAPVPSMCQSL